MKKRLFKMFAVMLSALMTVSVIVGVAACGKKEEKTENDKTLVVAYNKFSNKFSPFFATSAYDVDVYTMTQVGLLALDRGGNIVYRGIEGETTPYNGTDYTYYGLSNLVITQNQDGSVYYDITMRTGNKTVYFSDGKPVTVKDVIFSMYVLSDVDYDGATTFYSLPIKGMAEWRTNLSGDVYAKWSAISDAILATVLENGDFEYVEGEGYTQEQFESLAGYLADNAWEELARDIVMYVAVKYSEYLADYNNSEVATGMAIWGFEGEGDDENLFYDSNGKSYTLEGDDVPTLEDYADCLKAAYEDDIFTAAGVEAADGSIDSYFAAAAEGWIAESGAEDMDGATIDNISGITFDETAGTIRVETTEYSATTVYQLSLAVAPMHYYGDTTKWDPANGSYGFTRGNLNSVREKTTRPVGAGPYKFVSYTGGIVSFEANANYWEGAPKIKYLKFKEYDDADKLPALLNGDVDIANPSISGAVCNQIKEANGENTLSMSSPKVATDLTDNNGYGYIGINADLVNVGGKDNKASEASKNLRKAFATLFAAYREYTVSSYYEDRASVIQYPITNTSWAAPQPADEGYAIAFSKDVTGAAIYTADMNDEAKYAAAFEAAKGYFEAAGYTLDNGQFVAPEGAKTTFEVIIGGDGTGDHPTYALLTKVKEVLATVGITIEITDDSDNLFDRMEAGTVDMFVAAWGDSTDPDMYQVYHSDNKTNSNHYHIADEDLDALIIEARKSSDKNFRKATYKQCLDIILDWAVEIPVYQRKNCIVYSAERVDIATITPDTTPFWSYLAEIYKVDMK